MVSHLFFYQLTLIALVWLCVMLQWVWPSDPPAGCPTTPEPTPPPPKRHREPKPFAGLITKPPCDACEHSPAPRPQPPSAPPLRIVPTRGRRPIGANPLLHACVVSANLLHGFDHVNLQKGVRKAFPLTSQ